ncbi:MAG: flavodoxin family protein [Desulfovibrio sp.]|nr:flavodoxin family protein [Desulfovibrio sp.]
MKILVLNGSPHPHGNTKRLIDAFAEGAVSAGHRLDVLDVCKLGIAGCIACEHCHTKGNGQCAQKDGMQQIYALFAEADMLIVASPVYFGSISGQLKCVVDRLYALFTPQPVSRAGKPRKFASILSSAAPGVYDGSQAILEGSLSAAFGLEVVGRFTANGEENSSEAKLRELREFGKNL